MRWAAVGLAMTIIEPMATHCRIMASRSFLQSFGHVLGQGAKVVKL